MQNLIAQLGPTILRIGGTAADYSWYLPDDSRSGDGNAHTIINNTVWDSIIQLALNTNTQLMWDFDSLQFRDAQGNFDPSQNATAQLQYLQSKYGGKIDMIWSVGNEPDLWPKGSQVNASMLAEDAKILARTVAKYDLGHTVFGPAYAGFNKDSQEFMAAAGPAVNGFTCHNYPLGGHTDCSVDAYLDPSHLRDMGKSVAGIAAAKAASENSAIILTLEETGGSYGGGCDNITNRFVSGFWYLNAMGVVAYNGMDRIHRQDVAGWSFTGGMSHYELAGPPGWVNGAGAMMPHPDWYSAVLFKQIMGSSILQMSQPAAGQSGATQLFAWCGKAPGIVVILYTNPTGDDVSIDVSSSGVPNTPRNEYVLTSSAGEYREWQQRVSGGALAAGVMAGPPSTIQADEIYLNGALLYVDPATALLPEYPIPGKHVTDPSSLASLPPYSYGFMEFTGAGSAVC